MLRLRQIVSPVEPGSPTVWRLLDKWGGDGDVPGAIVSIDAADDPADWPWAGPDWRDHVGTTTVRAIAGMDVTVADPTGACATWGHVLGVTVRFTAPSG